ncbi:ABC transporter B family member 15 [Hibiscus syriacus]|uniref:ABC transporter B family member 15 n=1 Tax=Hibiscus syriacus TaxID=106335 RepID=A0A6A2YSX2_HIBSY|nr:ABC transporter B family member 15 [Hibiscus syriacus]
MTMADERKSVKEVENSGVKKKKWWIRSIFMHADGVDKCLMAAGFIGSVTDGTIAPLIIYLTGRLFNNIGGSNSADMLTRNIRQPYTKSSFSEGVCWARTSERQATRVRSRYLKAVQRQDVGYFDLNVTSTSEIVTSVSNDTLLIQEVISEKIPFLIARCATFIGTDIVAFLMLWRLALVIFPFVLLLVIPGLIYGKILLSLARKSRMEYNLASTIAEQAIPSIRTVHAFFGENNTSMKFSKALQESVKLGLKQGLARGLAIGSNGITHFIWAFITYYGSRLVMYHEARGGTVFVVGTCIAIGGQQLGSGLSTLKPLFEACSDAERINEVIKRAPKIDLENMEGEILENVRGEVEFKGVEFAYPSRPENMVFKDFCLKIPAGKTVALVGSSGWGKSTMISLLQRFYDPLGGDIVLDGVPINKLQLKWFRSQMGLVCQEPTLFATTIKENILFGKEDAEMEEIISAAKASNAHNFISQLPHGYETQVGERDSIVWWAKPENCHSKSHNKST